MFLSALNQHERQKDLKTLKMKMKIITIIIRSRNHLNDDSWIKYKKTKIAYNNDDNFKTSVLKHSIIAEFTNV